MASQVPGKYEGGEDGSPIIAVKAALEQRKPITAEVLFVFIEARKDRADHLHALISDMNLPHNFRWHVVTSTFDETLTEIIQHIERQNSALAPTFAFGDPFGYSHTPFSLIARLMKQRRCEVLVNFMFDEVNRFLSHDPQSSNFDALFGSNRWRECVAMAHSDDRKRCLHDTYKEQLEVGAGINYVRSFEMINDGNRTDYFLFFGTNGYAGLKAMKQAMWRVDRVGQYRFSDRSNFAQPYLIEPEPDYDLLKRLILQRFKGETFTDAELEKHVIVETPFLHTHYKTKILTPMERNGELKVIDRPRQRGHGYPQGTTLHIPD